VSFLQIGRRKLLQKRRGLLEGRGGGQAFSGERLDGYIESASERVKAGDGQIATALLHVYQEAAGERALLGQLALGEAAALADGAKTLPELLEIGVHGFG